MNTPKPPPGRPARWSIRPLHVHPLATITRPRELVPVMQTTLVATDIIGFGDRHRDVDAQLYLRQLMYELLVEASDITELPWWDCYREDRGDGVLIVAPPNIGSDRFLDPLIHHLNALLRRHARRANASTQLRLRIAIHHGCVYRDAHGVTGHALTHLFRLLDARVFRRAVATAGTYLGAIVSDQLYTEAIQRGGLINPAAYRQLHLTCKETRTRAWLWLPTESQPHE